MKKVIIISDSHGNLDNVRKIVEKEKNRYPFDNDNINFNLFV